MNNFEEANSLMSYMKTKLVNYLLSSKKVSQHISKKTVENIPLVPLNRIWYDEDVYGYFGLNNEEIEIVENFKY